MEIGVNIPNVILATTVLVLIILAFAGVFIGFFSLVYKFGTVFYRWLSHRAFYIRLRQRWQEWWKRNRLATTWWLESIAEVVIDPAFYGYVLVTLYQRVQAIGDYAKTHRQYSFWQLLNADMETHMQYYIVLFIIFIAWMFWKLEKHRKGIMFEKSTSAKLDKVNENIRQNSGDIKHLTASIEKLVEEIRKDRETKHGKPPTGM